MVRPGTLATSESFRSILHSSFFDCVMSFFLSSVCFCVSRCATCVRVDIVSTQPEPTAVQALGKTLESSQNTSDILGDMEVRVLSRLARWPCVVQPASPHAAQSFTVLHNTIATLLIPGTHACLSSLTQHAFFTGYTRCHVLDRSVCIVVCAVIHAVLGLCSSARL
jgi:hypothetical protein